MTEEVRPFERRDAADVALLEQQARAALTSQRGGLAHLHDVPSVGEWAPLLDDPSRRVFVAAIDDVVLGYLELVIDGELAEVRQVYVHPEARELGFGDGMLELATDAARAAGCRTLEGTALPGDRDTKNLYERAGIVARKIVVSRPL